MTLRDDLYDMQERAAKATKGPWEAMDLDHEINGERLNDDNGWWWVWRTAKRPFYGGVLEGDTDYTVRGDDGKTYHVSGAVGTSSVDDGNGGQQEKLDAEFISAARTDVPRLARILWNLLDLLDEKDLADQYAEKVGYQGGTPGMIEVSEIRAVLEPEDVASTEDAEKAVENALQNVGLTREELRLQGLTGQFSSTKARLAWVAVGHML